MTSITARTVLERHLLDMAARREVDARALLDEHESSSAPGCDEHSNARFGLEMLEAFFADQDDDAPGLGTLIEHHAHCGGGDTYRPGSRVTAVLESVTAGRDNGADDYRRWVQAAWFEMGRTIDGMSGDDI